MPKRREFIHSAGLAGIGVATVIGEAGTVNIEGGETEFAPGAPVVDLEDTTPDPAIVIKTPDVPIRDWLVDDEFTVADQNPTYDPNDPVVIVAFVDQLFGDWGRLSPGSLFDAVTDEGIKFYSFPSSRLRPI